MTPHRVQVRRRPDGSRVVLAQCPCVTAMEVISPWDALDETTARLKARHAAMAPLCKNPAARAA